MFNENVYKWVTERIIKQLEAGVAPWHKPWKSEFPRNLVSGKEYHGINVFMLGMQGYGSPYWLTYQQASERGAQVRKGQHATMIVFWKASEKPVREEDGTEEVKRWFTLRYYNVFNAEQCDNLEVPETTREVKPIPECKRIVEGMPNRPEQEQAGKAYYRPSTDTVGMPAQPLFEHDEAFYATMFHELVHSTGHPTRLSRFASGEKPANFGSDSYSKEELVAELGSAMLCGIAGISPTVSDNSAAYLQSWINALKGDSRLIIQAASAAQKAADYILGKEETREEPKP